MCLHSQFAIIEEGVFINAPSPLITPAYPWLAAILNSNVANWYIRQLGVTRNGGYFEYKPMFVKNLPLPNADCPKLEDLSKFVCRLNIDAREREAVQKSIDEFVAGIYGLSDEEIAVISCKKSD